MRKNSHASKFDEMLKHTDSGCLLWSGYSIKSNGLENFRYGRLGINGRKMLAHRYAYERAHGPIPEGMHVLHKCDTPLCCNVDHLFLGTHKENMNDMHGKDRSYSGPVTWAPKGEKHRSAKLTEEVIMNAKILHFFSGVSQSQLSRAYRVNNSVMHRAITGKTWKHIKAMQVPEIEVKQ